MGPVEEPYLKISRPMRFRTVALCQLCLVADMRPSSLQGPHILAGCLFITVCALWAYRLHARGRDSQSNSAACRSNGSWLSARAHLRALLCAPAFCALVCVCVC